MKSRYDSLVAEPVWSLSHEFALVAYYLTRWRTEARAYEYAEAVSMRPVAELYKDIIQGFADACEHLQTEFNAHSLDTPFESPDERIMVPVPKPDEASVSYEYRLVSRILMASNMYRLFCANALEQLGRRTPEPIVMSEAQLEALKVSVDGVQEGEYNRDDV